MTSSAHVPPILPKHPSYIGFGNVPGPTRGDVPLLDPVLYLKDDYFYVRDDARENPQVLEHLDAENAHTRHQLAHLEPVRKEIYDELLSHVQETDSGYPYPDGDFEYYHRTEKGLSYPMYCRRPTTSTSSTCSAQEQVILDQNELAKGHKHCGLACMKASPDHQLLAYAVDFQGYETYTLYFKDLATNEILADMIPGIAGRVAWGRDQKCVYYTKFDDAHREHEIWKHTLGDDTSDVLIYSEPDSVFSVRFFKTRSGRFLMFGSGSSESDEYYYIDLIENPEAVSGTMIQPRVDGMQYDVDHHGDHFYIVTNADGATNFKLMQTRISSPGQANWTPVMPYDAAKKIDGVDCFAGHVVIFGRERGFTQMWIQRMNHGEDNSIKQLVFDEPIYTLSGSTNKFYDTSTYRFSYSSMTTPSTLFDLDMNTLEKTFLKERPCPNYDRSLYTSERWEATNPEDGTLIPMSVIYRKDQRQEGTSGPVHLYGYGSYEISIDPSFSSHILPLLDRGVTYVIAHVRGGGEMGRTWYEDAKYLTKRKTFDDFVACAEYLVDQKITTPSQLTCEGRSAGGLLMGAVLNMRPDLFQAAIAGVPFVDVMNSMCDSTIPLTTGEWMEWYVLWANVREYIFLNL